MARPQRPLQKTTTLPTVYTWVLICRRIRKTLKQSMFSGRAIKKGLFCGFTKHRAVVGVLYASLAPPGLWNWRMSEINDSYEKSLFWKSLYLKEEFLPFQTFSGHRKSLQEIMVLISDGYSEIGTHVRSNICYLICLRHLIISRAVTKDIFLVRKDQFSLMHAKHDLKYHLIKVPWQEWSWNITKSLK